MGRAPCWAYSMHHPKVERNIDISASSPSHRPLHARRRTTGGATWKGHRRRWGARHARPRLARLQRLARGRGHRLPIAPPIRPPAVAATGNGLALEFRRRLIELQAAESGERQARAWSSRRAAERPSGSLYNRARPPARGERHARPGLHATGAGRSGVSMASGGDSAGMMVGRYGRLPHGRIPSVVRQPRCRNQFRSG